MCMDKHLTEQELAQYVDALVLEKQDQLPEDMREHAAECRECKVEVMEIMESSGDNESPSS